MGGIRECLDRQKICMHDTARLDYKVTTKSGEKGEKRFLQAIPHPGGHSREVWVEVCRKGLKALKPEPV